MKKTNETKIFEMFKPLFKKCGEIKSVSFWLSKYDKLTVNEEDITINGKFWFEYINETADKNSDIIRDFEEKINDFQGEEKESLVHLFASISKKYEVLLRQSPVLKAIDSFDFANVDIKPFENYFGERYPWNEDVFFTVFSDGKTSYKETWKE